MQTARDLASLYPELGARIYSYLRRLTQDAALAEDLTQETFLRAVQNLHTFRGEGELANWLYRIATNLFRDHLCKRKSTEQPLWEDREEQEGGENSLSLFLDPSPPVSQLLERRAVRQRIRDCIALLPAPYRATLLLYVVEGKTVEESAIILGCSKETVKVRLHRGRSLFEALVTEQCEVSVERDGEVSCIPKALAKEPMP
jgi:RNA polymerase sigma-70 factor (ECF subfamily)